MTTRRSFIATALAAPFAIAANPASVRTAIPPSSFQLRGNLGAALPIESLGKIIARKRAEQTEGIMRGWLREELGPDCPSAAEDMVMIAVARGYSFLRIIPRGGDTETLALQRDGKTIRSIGLPKPF